MALGACCFRANVGCAVRTDTECAAGGGIYMGDGVSCNDIDCGNTLWSCCDTTTIPPTCTDLTEADCLSLPGRVPRSPAGCPDGLNCGTISIAACCRPDGQCFQVDVDECLANGGCPGEPGQACSDVDCDGVTMSCCVFANGQQECFPGFSRIQCIENLGGTPMCPAGCGSAVNCEQIQFGACCRPDGSCTQTDGPSDCDLFSGIYQGDGTLCSDPGVSCDGPDESDCVPAQEPSFEPGDVHYTPNLCGLALLGYYRRNDNDDEGNTLYGKYRLVTLHETRSTQVAIGADQCRYHVGMFGMLPDGRVALALCSRHNSRSALSFGGFVQQPDGVDDPNGILEQGQWAGVAATANPRTGEVHLGSHASYCGVFE